MSVSLNIPMNLAGFSTLKAEIKAAGKEIQTLEKEVEKARKAGKAVSDDVIKKLGAAESKQAALRKRLETDGSRLKYDEDFANRSARNFQNFNVRGMIGDKIEGFFNQAARSPGALNSILQNRALNAATGGAGNLAITQGLGRGMAALSSTAAAYAGPVGIAASIGYAFKEGMSITSHYSEDLRKARNEFNVQMADANFTDPVERALAAKKMQATENEKDRLGLMANSTIGTIATFGTIKLANFIRNRRQGVDAYSTQDTELRAHGVNKGQMDAMKSKAKDRLWADSFGSEEVGFIAQNTYGKIKDIVGSNEDAAEQTAEVKRMHDKFTAFTAQGDERAVMGDFEGAKAAYAAAASEMPGLNKNWRNPMQIWIANDQSILGAKRYAQSINPLPALRIGQ